MFVLEITVSYVTIIIIAHQIYSPEKGIYKEDIMKCNEKRNKKSMLAMILCKELVQMI